MITLVQMTQSEFESYLGIAVPHLASELSKARNVNAEEGKRLARESFQSLFPEWQVDAADQFVSKVMDGDSRVGFVHFGIKRDRPDPYLYVWDIFIDPEHRGKSYGKKAMLAAEGKAKELGLHQIRLNVFGHNSTALNLYQGIGYLPESLTMAKVIEEGAKPKSCRANVSVSLSAE